MSSPTKTIALLAAANPFEAMGRNFRGDNARLQTSDVIGIVTVLALAAIACYVLKRLLAREQANLPYRSPRRLFHELCQAHGLQKPQRRLLRELAEHHQLPQPAAIFLQPERFNLTRLGDAWAVRGAEITALAEQLFAGPRANQSASGAG